MSKSAQLAAVRTHRLTERARELYDDVAFFPGPDNGGYAISMLPYATPGSLTYFDGDDPAQVEHLDEVFLVCRHDLPRANSNISYLAATEPKALFYSLSHLYASNDSFAVDSDVSSHFPGASIGVDCEIGERVVIHPHAVVRSGTRIGDGCVVESGTVLGSTGLLWTWSSIREQKVLLSLTGHTSIGSNTYICANNTIVRGACNETTTLGKNVMLAPGSAIGHGATIGDSVHFANGVCIGGSAIVGAGCFLGSSAVVQPSVSLAAGSVLGANGTLTRVANEPGVYAGTPARRIGPVTDKLRGVPPSQAASR